MIYPIQKVLPLSIPGEAIDTITEKIPALGPLHLRICEGLDFTSEYEMPIVRPEFVEPPYDIKAFHRLKGISENVKKDFFGHFYTLDRHFESVWNRPYSFIPLFRKLGGIISPDYSILDNMLKEQRFWNDFRNKLLSAFYQRWNIPVIASPVWCSDMKNIMRFMDGWPHNSIVAVNSTGVCRDKRSRHIWLDGYFAMIDILKPTHILRYGGKIEGELCEISTYYTNNNNVNSHGR